jgi:hypothetical protein
MERDLIRMLSLLSFSFSPSLSFSCSLMLSLSRSLARSPIHTRQGGGEDGQRVSCAGVGVALNLSLSSSSSSSLSRSFFASLPPSLLLRPPLVHQHVTGTRQQ